MRSKTLFALYDDFEDASSAVTDLTQHAFSGEDITLLVGDPGGRDVDGEESGDLSAGEGASLGVVGGLLVGLGALTIPGIGPAIVSGPLAAILTGTTVGVTSGAITGGIVGGLVDMGASEKEAHYYSEGVRRGGTLVMVQIHKTGKINTANDILEVHNPVDIKRRVGTWKAEEGWEAFDPEAEPYSEDS